MGTSDLTGGYVKPEYQGKRYGSYIMQCLENEIRAKHDIAYHQRENILWADYSGGEIRKGYLVGTVVENGELDFYYQHINEQKQIRIGVCRSIPQVLENGRIELSEKWQWLNGDRSEGASVIIESL